MEVGILMSEGAPGGLFGRIAIKQGFVTQQQVEACVRIQEDLLKVGVWKPLGMVMVEQGFLKQAQVDQILKLQEYRDQRGDDKKLAHTIVQNEFATQAQIDDALAYQKEFFKNNGYALPLEEILVQKGIINVQQCRALKKSMKRQRTTSREETLVGVKECPQCFEYIPRKSDQCPHCKFIMGKLQIKFQCKACNAPVDNPGEFCHDCGANRVTGQMPAPDQVKKCPACGKYNAVYQADCTNCGKPFFVETARKALGRAKTVAQALLSYAAPLLILGAIVWTVFNFGLIGRIFSKAVEGEAADVRREVKAWLEAVAHQDTKGAVERMTPGRQYSDVATYLQQPGSDVVLRDYTITSIQVEADRATVYVDLIFGRVEKAKDLMEQLGNPGVLNRKVTLYWRKTDRWRLE